MKFSANHQAQGKEPAVTAETLPVFVSLWSEGFSDIPTDALEAAFRSTLCRVRFFPTVADVRAQLEPAHAASYEAEWQALLDYMREWFHPDIVFSGTPSLPPDVDHAARAAGGLRFLFDCPGDKLVWAKKAFIEDLARTRTSGELAGLLPGGSLRAVLQKARTEYAPRLAAPSEQQPRIEKAAPPAARPATRPLSAAEEEARRAELRRQAKIILQKYGSLHTSAEGSENVAVSSAASC